MRRSQTITSDVFDYLLGLIRSRAVSPGERLPTEKDLVAELGVSRTCVREAIKSLEALQIIVVKPRSGAIVREPSASALFNAELFATAVAPERADILLEFRRVVEGGFAALAAEKARPQDLEAIGKTIQAYENCLKDGVLPYEADIAFHASVAAASQNPLGQLVLEGIARPLSEQMKLAEPLPNASDEALRDHLKIFGAIAERNPDRARAAMLSHLANAERYWRIANSGLASQDVVGSLPTSFTNSAL